MGQSRSSPCAHRQLRDRTFPLLVARRRSRYSHCSARSPAGRGLLAQAIEASALELVSLRSEVLEIFKIWVYQAQRDLDFLQYKRPYNSAQNSHCQNQPKPSHNNQVPIILTPVLRTERWGEFRSYVTVYGRRCSTARLDADLADF